MKTPRSEILARKSLSAALAAIEVYNKPEFRYREEAFAILMTNAWELLLKAKVVKDAGNKLGVLHVRAAKTLSNGKKSKKLYLKRNRSGNPLTIDMLDIAERLRQNPTSGLTQPCADNLDLLVEIRDNAIHFYNKDRNLRERLQGVACAAIKNYAILVQRWFGFDLSRYNFYLVPLSFFPEGEIEALPIKRQSREVERVLAYIRQREAACPADEASPFAISLRIDARLVRTTSSDALPVQVTRDSSAPKIQLTEEEIRKTYKWTYEQLTKALRGKYSDFKENAKFHGLRKPLEARDDLCRERRLDIENPRSAKQKFYNPNIVREFDRHYIAK